MFLRTYKLFSKIYTLFYFLSVLYSIYSNSSKQIKNSNNYIGIITVLT